MAKFDVIITAPEMDPDEGFFEYRFLSDTDVKGFVFQVINNGETDILCNPYIDDVLMYRIYVEERECTEFVVPANETISFWLVLAPIGLDTNVKDIKFFIDIHQMEGE